MKRCAMIFRLMALSALTLIASEIRPAHASRFDPDTGYPGTRIDFFMNYSPDFLAGTWIVDDTQSWLGVWWYQSQTLWPYFAQAYADCSGRPVVVEAYNVFWVQEFDAQCMPGEQLTHGNAFLKWDQ